MLTTYDILRNNTKKLAHNNFVQDEDDEDAPIWDYMILDEGHLHKGQKDCLRFHVPTVSLSVVLLYKIILRNCGPCSISAVQIYLVTRKSSRPNTNIPFFTVMKEGHQIEKNEWAQMSPSASSHRCHTSSYRWERRRSKADVMRKA